jgi:zinc protease
MIIKNILHLILFSIIFVFSFNINAFSESDKSIYEQVLGDLKSRIYTYKLDNGMHVVCIKATNTNMVRVGSYVEVGSVHEASNEWGMAHILEHMVFKGTKTRKEGELGKLCNRFGLKHGDYNAHTWYDHTFYYFDTDQANWTVFADVIADSAQNLLVTPVALDSELQAITQEIKLRKSDQNGGASAIDFFPFNHPIVHEVIGYKEQVLGFTADDVMAFYNKHYTPEKTTFFVCGNVDPELVFTYAKKTFANFNRVGTPAPIKGVASDQPFYAGFAQVNRVQYHTGCHKTIDFCWNIPAAGAPGQPAFKYISDALSRRLKERYIDQLGYCFTVSAAAYCFQMGGFFYVTVAPRPEYEQFNFAAEVKNQLDDIMQNGLSDIEMQVIKSCLLKELVGQAEDPVSIPYNLVDIAAYSYDPVTSFFDFKKQLIDVTQDLIRDITSRYLKSFLMHTREVVPLPLTQQSAWQELQKQVSLHEAHLLQSRARTDVSALVATENNVLQASPNWLELPEDIKYNEFVLPNGLTVYWYSTDISPRCCCGLVLKDSQRFYIPLQMQKKSFVISVMPDMFTRGTDEYSEKEFKDLLDIHGIELFASVRFIAVHAFKNNIADGLRFMRMALDKKTYDAVYLERKKQEAIDVLNSSQNSPWYRLCDYIDEQLSQFWPWKFGAADILNNIKNVTIDDIALAFSTLKNPAAVAAVIVGNFTESEVYQLAYDYFGDFCSQPLNIPSFDVAPVDSVFPDTHIDLPVENTLVAAVRMGSVKGGADTASITLLKDFFNKKVWNIRERTGLFYSGGSFYYEQTNRIPGLFGVFAQTTPGNCASVQDELRLVLKTIVNEETFRELQDEFKRSCSKHCTTPRTITSRISHAVLDDTPINEDRLFMEQVAALTYEQFSSTVASYCDPATWSFITVGAKA